MAIHKLSKDTISEIILKDGKAQHKFVTLPRHIFFGNDGEYHNHLLRFLEEEKADLVAEELEFFEQRSLQPCGNHLEAQRLAVVDAGFMVVEGIDVPEIIDFTGRSESYGLGDRHITSWLAQQAVGGTWRLHVPAQES